MNESIHILIVEDSPRDAELAQRQILKAIGDCEFQVVETREDYLSALEIFQPEVILSDYNMPRFDGMTALKLAREYAPLTPLIIWTGSMNEDIAVECMKAGANNYVIKENIIRLGSAVAHALEEGKNLLEHKHAEESLRESEERYRDIFNGIQDTIFVETLDGRILAVNDRACEMYGYTHAEFLTKTVADLVPEGQSIIAPSGEEIPFSLIETVNLRSNGERFPVEVSGRIQTINGEKVLLVIVRDITERKKIERLTLQYAYELEQRVEERTAELIHANLTKDEFLANMSHELRTPLNGILGFSESLLEGVYGMVDESQNEAIGIIQTSGQHLLGLINDILDVSKIESGRFELQLENVSVNDICKSSLVFVKQLALKKSISLEYSPSPYAPTIFADSKRLKQILVNLLNNAVKFTPENGTVKLEVREDTQVGQMRFSVTDSGIGISPEDLQKLFKPFIQLDSSLSRQYEGSGLGLVLVKQLAEMHGGSVGVESKADNGSCFYFTLPIQPSDAPTAETQKLSAQINPNETADSEREEKKRILVVEDNAVSMMVTSDYLIEKGYEVIKARDGFEAIELAQE